MARWFGTQLKLSLERFHHKVTFTRVKTYFIFKNSIFTCRSYFFPEMQKRLGSKGTFLAEFTNLHPIKRAYGDDTNHSVSRYFAVRGYATGSAKENSEPGDVYRKLMARKQALQMELRQRSISESNYCAGSKLGGNITLARGAVRLGLASGPGLLVSSLILI